MMGLPPRQHKSPTGVPSSRSRTWSTERTLTIPTWATAPPWSPRSSPSGSPPDPSRSRVWRRAHTRKPQNLWRQRTRSTSETRTWSSGRSAIFPPRSCHQTSSTISAASRCAPSSSPSTSSTRSSTTTLPSSPPPCVPSPIPRTTSPQTFCRPSNTISA